ncbi:unnamed protein product [Paramecium sonneborni]|uniref:Uncharacterized protein n=1 Tax=Paramecium sonneborni TaxID=65129 RepID=A0A8S1MMN4_9CILI|nr:unnamed protein product [Paramecium sonneborni]CAD8078463.1 unnamed protein product [Paramecium sonneborni]
MYSKQLKFEQEYENPNKENQGPQDIIQTNLLHSNRPPLIDITDVLYPKKKYKKQQWQQQQINVFMSTVSLR